MSISRITLDCGCEYQLHPRMDSWAAHFPGDIMWHCLNECDTADALLSKWRSERRDGSDEAMPKAYFEHVRGGLQRSVVAANVG